MLQWIYYKTVSYVLELHQYSFIVYLSLTHCYILFIEETPGVFYRRGSVSFDSVSKSNFLWIRCIVDLYYKLGPDRTFDLFFPQYFL